MSRKYRDETNKILCYARTIRHLRAAKLIEDTIDDGSPIAERIGVERSENVAFRSILGTIWASNICR